MTKKIDIMEMGISLARLFRLAFKNYQVILSSFFLGLLLAYGYTTSPLIDQGTYQTTGSVAYRVSTNATVLNTILEIVKSPAVADLAVTALEEAEGQRLRVQEPRHRTASRSQTLQERVSMSTLRPTRANRPPGNFLPSLGGRAHLGPADPVPLRAQGDRVPDAWPGPGRDPLGRRLCPRDLPTRISHLRTVPDHDPEGGRRDPQDGDLHTVGQQAGQ